MAILLPRWSFRSQFQRWLIPVICAVIMLDGKGSSLAQTAPQQTSTRPTTGLQENRPVDCLLKNARIFVLPEKQVEKSDLMIRRGLIAQVGNDLLPDPGMLVIDCSEKTIYPGLIDAYSEQKVDAAASVNSDWNANVHPELSIADYYKPDAGRNEQYRQSGFVARLIAPNAGQIKGTSALVSTADEAGSRQTTFTGDVGLHVSLTVGRFGRDGYPGSPMGALTLVRQSLYDVDWYDAASRSASVNTKVVRPDVNESLSTLKRLRDDKVPLIIDASNELYALRGDTIAREFSWPTILRGSGREYRRLADIAQTGWSIIVPLQFPKAPDVSTPEAARAATLERLMHWDIAPQNPQMLADAGVSIAFTTHGLDKIGESISAVRKAIQRGLSTEAALTALTMAPAKMFGVDHRLGSIEPGKLASFIVVKGDLFDKEAKIVETWVEGHRFEIERPDQDIRGTWTVDLADSSDQRLDASFVIKGSLKRLAGTATINGQKIKLSQIQWEGGRLSVDIPAKKIDREGIARATIFVDDQQLTDRSFVGRWYWPNGECNSVSASWKAPVKKSDSEEQNAEGVDTRQDEDADNIDSDKNKNAAEQVERTTESNPETTAKPELSEEESSPEGGDVEESSDNATNPTAKDDADIAEKQVPPKPIDDSQIAEKESREAEETDPSHEGEDVEIAAAKEGKKKTTADEEDDSVDQPPITEPLYGVNYPLGAYGLESEPSQPKSVAFTHATVWTSGPDGVLNDATVLVRSGKIEAVGTDIEVPADVLVFNLSGKHISPGIIDCHSHIATDGGLNESTQAITAEVRISDFIDPNDISIYRQLAGGTTAANVLHGSANPIGGQNQVIKLRWGSNPESLKFKHAPPGIKFALGENVKQSNWGDNNRTRYPQTRMGVEELIVDAFERALVYRERKKEWSSTHQGTPPRFDLELEALEEVLAGTRWIHCHSYRQSEILSLMKICDRYDVTIGTFQHILEGYKVADEMAKRGIMASAFADWWAYKFEVYDAIPYAAAIMHNAGVVVSLNSDDAELGRHLNIDAAKAVKYGNVPEQEALKFVTLNPAKQLRIDKYVGSLEAGKDADLVVWSTSPLSIYAVCEQTWVDGRQYFSLESEKKLHDRDAARHAALVQRILQSKAAQLRADEDDKTAEALWPREDIFCHGHDHEHE